MDDQKYNIGFGVAGVEPPFLVGTRSGRRLPRLALAVRLLFVSGSLLLSIPTTTLGQSVSGWTNTSSSSAWYENPGNWVGQSPPPGPFDFAVFDQNASYEVWWDVSTGNRNLAAIDVNAGSVFFRNLAGQQYSLTVSGLGNIDDFRVRGPTYMELQGLHFRSLGGATVDTGAAMSINGFGSQFSVSGAAGFEINGNLSATNGGAINSTTSRINSTSFLMVQGSGSSFTSSSSVNISGGAATIYDGGTFNAQSLEISGNGGLAGHFSIGDFGSSASIGSIVVGGSASGTMGVSGGAWLNSGATSVGVFSGSTGVVNVNSSIWNGSNLVIGEGGTGTLNLNNGSVSTAGSGTIGKLAGSMGTVYVDQGIWSVDGSLSIADAGTGTLYVTGESGQVFVGGTTSVGTSGQISLVSGGAINSTTTHLNGGTLSVVGNGSSFTSSSAVNISGGNAFVYDGGTFNALSLEISGDGSSTGNFSIGDFGFGFSFGSASIGSIVVGGSGSGTMILNNGVLNSGSTTVGLANGSTGVVNVYSNWYSSSDLVIGEGGIGTLNLYNDGYATTSGSGVIGKLGSSVGTVNVSQGSWSLNGSLSVADAGSGTLNIGTGGYVSVGGTTTIGTNGQVNLDGGTFNFGQIALSNLNRINANSGTLRGAVIHSQYSHVNGLTELTNLVNSSVDYSGVTLSNTGTLYGQGSLEFAFANQATGEVEVLSGERMRFGSTAVSTNAGEINNYGGMIRFEGSLQNLSTGFIGGRGQMIADGGWNNSGSIVFSGGYADVLGDVANISGGRIITTGGATTTFFDDVVHNGLEIKTALNANTVFLGSVTGAGDYTGAGDLYFEGDMRPGNSPEVVSFGGNVNFGKLSLLEIEIAGLAYGEFDKLLIGGNLALDGGLLVSLIDGFQLGADQEFVFAEVDGSLFGQFDGLGEGALVRNFGGYNLFITYQGGDGNDVALFTNVPEPHSVAILLGGLVSFLGLQRRRR